MTKAQYWEEMVRIWSLVPIPPEVPESVLASGAVPSITPRDLAKDFVALFEQRKKSDKKLDVRMLVDFVAERRGVAVCLAAREHGVFLRPLGDIIVLMPPLTLSDAELDQLVDAIAYGIEAALPGTP